MFTLRTLLWLSVLAITLPVFAQQQSIYDDDTRTLYSREIYGGVVVHGDGWGAHLMYGRYRTANDRELIGLEFVTMKHPKEIKSYNPYYENSRGYFYGKLNSMLVLRPMYGHKYRIAEKIRKSGVELNVVWGVGPSLGLLKPVYLQIGYGANGQPIAPYATIQEERYDPTKHFANNIYGRASWFRGLGELKVYPGLSGRVALNFEYAGNNTGIRGIEVGATLDAYAEKVPIMAEIDGVENKQFFLEFYLSLQIGGKKIR